MSAALATRRPGVLYLLQPEHKPVPAEASDGERTFVFICREYVKEFAPTTLKGLSKLDMQAKVKEKQEAAK